MTEFAIKHRFTEAVMFTAALEAEYDNAAASVRMGIAVTMAIQAGTNLSGANLSGACLSGANLSGADLSGADLSGANLADAYLVGTYLAGTNLSGANLSGAYSTGANLAAAYLAGADLNGADLIDGGQRADGFRFLGWINAGVLQIRAGCRNLTITDARAYWSDPEYPDERLGQESMLILDRIESTAKIRGMI